jgi:superfamily II DNA/RNA helicase
MDKEAHEHGDIIVTMPKSFLNRCQRGNLKFDNCKFIAIDEVDDIFEQEKSTLGEILKIAEDNRPNVITCSATMKKEFTQFYEDHVKDVIKFNISEMVQKELGEKITLEGVKNYYKVMDSKAEMHKYIIGTIFSELFDKKKAKPQIFIFFDSIDEIRDFHEYFKAKVRHIVCRPVTSLQINRST